MQPDFPRHRLNALLSALDLPVQEIDVDINGLCLDSRHLQSGELFIALRGHDDDGHRFIREALNKGAIAVLYEDRLDVLTQQEAQTRGIPLVRISGLRQRLGELAGVFYAHPTRQFKLLGVTGTDGKTSITHYIAQALHYLGRACGVLGTVGNGIYPKLERTTLTTLDAIALNKQLGHFVGAADTVVMEVSSHSLDQQRVQGLEFATAILSNLSRDHLDYHGSLDAYRAAKQRLFEWPGLRHAVLNMNDAFGQVLANRLPPNVTLYAYGLDIPPYGKHWVSGRNLQLHTQGFSLEIETEQAQAKAEIALLGRFNAENVLAVVAALLTLQLPFEEVMAAVAGLRGVPGRMQLVHKNGCSKVVIDYAHTPQALESVLEALRAHCDGRLFCVFGCGGDRDKGKRPLMGEVALRLADCVIVTDDNPRTENPQSIVQDIIREHTGHPALHVQHDRKKAIQSAISMAAVDDLVLIAGKGHEDYQIIGTQVLALNDAAVVTECLGL